MQRPIRCDGSQERGPSSAVVPSKIALPSPTRCWESCALFQHPCLCQRGMLFLHMNHLPFLPLSFSLFTYKADIREIEQKWKRSLSTVLFSTPHNTLFLALCHALPYTPLGCCTDSWWKDWRCHQCAEARVHLKCWPPHTVTGDSFTNNLNSSILHKCALS